MIGWEVEGQLKCELTKTRRLHFLIQDQRLIVRISVGGRNINRETVKEILVVDLGIKRLCVM